MSVRDRVRVEEMMNAPEKFSVIFRFALLTVVVTLRNLTLLSETHAWAVLPCHALFALYHEVWRVCVVI